MKVLGKLMVGLLSLVALMAASAAADTVSVSQVIHLTGVVPPMRFIVVNNQGDIIEITSNTPQNVTPTVHLDSISGANMPLTTALQQDFQKKIAGKDLHSADLHFAMPAPQVAKNKQPSWLSLFKPISILHW